MAYWDQYTGGGSTTDKARRLGTTSAGVASGGIVGGVAGDVAGQYKGGDPGRHLASSWQRATGFGGGGGGVGDEYRSSLEKQYQAEQGVLGKMKEYDDQYWTATQPYFAKYQDDVRKLREQAEGQATDARQTYTNTIFPEMQNIMEDAKVNAGQAMSLQQAGDPNNAIHQSIRDMYNQQASNVGRQGMADAGVLQAMGTQATAQQFGQGGMMSGGQLAALQGANLTQAGMATQRAQQHMQRLREQGIERGFRESGLQYERGERARDRYAGSVADMMNAEGIQQQRDRMFRGEIGGMAGQQFGMGMGQEGLYRDLGLGQQERELASIQGLYGREQGLLSAEQAAANAQQAGKMQALGGLLGAGAIGAGYAFGGPAGGMAGMAAAPMLSQAAVGAGSSYQAAPGQQTQGYRPSTYQDPYQQQYRYGQGGTFTT